jgi:DNA-binding MarR family transcriptional regulator
MNKSEFAGVVDLIEDVCGGASKFFMQRFKTACNELNLLPIHGHMLLFLSHRQERFSQSEICEYMEKDTSTFSRLIDGIEKMGLVRRIVSQENRRANLVELTDMGQAEAAKLWERMNDIYFELLKPLDKSDLETVKVICEKIKRSLPR